MFLLGTFVFSLWILPQHDRVDTHRDLKATEGLQERSECLESIHDKEENQHVKKSIQLRFIFEFLNLFVQWLATISEYQLVELLRTQQEEVRRRNHCREETLVDCDSRYIHSSEFWHSRKQLNV